MNVEKVDLIAWLIFIHTAIYSYIKYSMLIVSGRAYYLKIFCVICDSRLTKHVKAGLPYGIDKDMIIIDL